MKSRRSRQGEFAFVNWGGKRRGAGRKPKGDKAGVPHDKRPKLARRHPVHVTVKLERGLPNLRRKEAHRLVRCALAGASLRDEFHVVEYSVQANHMHFIAESRNERALTMAMRGLTVRIARALNKLWKRAGRVFADRYHSRILKTPREVRNALVYVLQNARKHRAWTRANAPDPFSSGQSFDGWRAAGRPEPTFLSRARTWLLSIGWKRHGLLSLHELPAT